LCRRRGHGGPIRIPVRECLPDSLSGNGAVAGASLSVPTHPPSICSSTDNFIPIGHQTAQAQRHIIVRFQRYLLLQRIPKGIAPPDLQLPRVGSYHQALIITEPQDIADACRGPGVHQVQVRTLLKVSHGLEYPYIPVPDPTS
jgi:hypothetical protein